MSDIINDFMREQELSRKVKTSVLTINRRQVMSLVQ